MSNLSLNRRPWAALLALSLAFAVSCTSDSGPTEDEEVGDSRGVYGEDVPGRGAPPSRDPSGTADADRMGLQTAYFDYDSFSLREDTKSALRADYEILRTHPDVRVEIQGNCDERGSEEYNLALGERRARAAREYLLALGLSANRITTVSFGENNPAAMGHDERAWERNRRADFAVLP